MFESFRQYVNSAVGNEESVLELSRQFPILGNCRPIIQPLLVSPRSCKLEPVKHSSIQFIFFPLIIHLASFIWR